MSNPSDLALSRRALIGGAAGGGLLLSFHLPSEAKAAAGFAPNAFIRIDPRGKVLHRGIHQSLAAFLWRPTDVRCDDAVFRAQKRVCW